MKLLVTITFTLLSASMLLSLFLMSSDMEMSYGMSDCPFMAHEEVLCPMDLMDHLEAWKSVFLGNAITVSVLVTVVLLILLVPSFVAIASKLRYIRRHKILRKFTYLFSHRLLKELFSNGILNPKVY